MSNEQAAKTPSRIVGEIISIGDEITNGSIVDTNSAYLSQELSELGVKVLYHSTVGDDLDAMVNIFKTAALRSDVIIVTGGLGPTEDDLTRQAAADCVGEELVQDLDSLGHIRRLFKIRGREMKESNIIQSYFPNGAEVLFNPHGTAPGFQMEINREPLGGKGVSFLMAYPGVPAELKEMWPDVGKDQAEAWINKHFTRRHYILRRTIHCFGAGESELESRLPHLIARDHVPSVGITASAGVITLRITSEGEDYQHCIGEIEETAKTIYENVGEFVYGEAGATLPLTVCKILQRKKMKLAVLEWGTKGFLCKQVDPSVFLGGVVANSSGASLRHLLGYPADAPYEEIIREYQKRTGADAVIAVGRFPQGDELALAEKFYVPVYALLGTELRQERFVYGLHPAIIDAVFANRAFNLLRKMLKESQDK